MIVCLAVLACPARAGADDTAFQAWFVGMWASLRSSVPEDGIHVRYSIVPPGEVNEVWTIPSGWRADVLGEGFATHDAHLPTLDWKATSAGLVYVAPIPSLPGVPKAYALAPRTQGVASALRVWTTGGLEKIYLRGGAEMPSPTLDAGGTHWTATTDVRGLPGAKLRLQGVWDAAHRQGVPTDCAVDGGAHAQADPPVWNEATGRLETHHVRFLRKGGEVGIEWFLHQSDREVGPAHFVQPGIGGELADGTSYPVGSFTDYTFDPPIALVATRDGRLVERAPVMEPSRTAAAQPRVNTAVSIRDILVVWGVPAAVVMVLLIIRRFRCARLSSL